MALARIVPAARRCDPVLVSIIAPSPDAIMIAMGSPTMMFKRRLIFASVFINNIQAFLLLQYLLLGFRRRVVTCAIMCCMIAFTSQLYHAFLF